MMNMALLSKWIWGNENDENNSGFSVSAAYTKLSEPDMVQVVGNPKELILRKGIPIRVQFFAWTASLDRIATYDLLRRKGFILANHCSLCLNDLETTSHILVHCRFVHGVWATFLHHYGVCWTMPFSILDLLLQWQWQYPWQSRRGKLIWEFIPHAISLGKL